MLSNIIRRLGVSSSLCFRGQERTRGAGSDQTRPHRQGRGVAARLWLRLRLGRSRERARGRPPEHVPAMARRQELGINGLHREKLWFWPSHQQIISTHLLVCCCFFFNPTMFIQMYANHGVRINVEWCEQTRVSLI